MLYSFVCEDVANSGERRAQYRDAHRARLQQLVNEGRLVLAGPNPNVDADTAEAGFSGSIIVAEFPTLAEAKAWAKADPYAIHGVYHAVTVKPFKQVLP